MMSVDAQAAYVFGDTVRTLYTYGSHDKNAVDSYEDKFFSGPVEGTGYYIYGISYAQMVFDTDEQARARIYDEKDVCDPRGICAQTASHHFLTWVKGLEDHLPIIVMSHVPLHAHRNDNRGAWTWTRALNAAAKDHDIIFLWGHNHTMERGEAGKETERAHYLHLPGDQLTVQSWDMDEEGSIITVRSFTDEEGNETREPVAQTETLEFVYLNAGYLTNGVGSVLTFSGTDGVWKQLTVKRYAITEEEEAEPFSIELRSWE